MPLWNNNDLENSKPSWLTEEQKRLCFRTVRGWEIPLAGQGFTGDAENIFGATSVDDTATAYLYRSGTFVGATELLVAMPIDDRTSVNFPGTHNSELRGFTSSFGATNGSDLPNYKTYFTSPSSSVTGVTGSRVYATKGITSYIPVIVSDVNLTDLPKRFVFGGLTTSDGGVLTGLSLLQGFTNGTFTSLYNAIGVTQAGATSQLIAAGSIATYSNLVFNQPTTLRGMTAPAAYWDTSTSASYVVNRYGGWGGITQGAAVLIVSPSAVTGTYNLRINVFDGRASGGVTGTINFPLEITSGHAY
jgi:hypothetical protein